MFFDDDFTILLSSQNKILRQVTQLFILVYAIALLQDLLEIRIPIIGWIGSSLLSNNNRRIRFER